MKRLMVAPMLALALSGCGLAQRAVTSPGSVAAHTSTDEEARKRCEQTYKLSRIVMEIGVDAGLLKGARASQATKLDMELYGALNVCRTAYRLFNGPALVAAADDMDKQSDALSATVQERND